MPRCECQMLASLTISAAVAEPPLRHDQHNVLPPALHLKVISEFYPGLYLALSADEKESWPL